MTHLGAHQTSTLFPTESSPAAAGTPRLDSEAWQPLFSSPLLQQTLFMEEKPDAVPLAFLSVKNLNSPSPGNEAANRLS